MTEILSAAFLLTGVALYVIAAVGINRFPDVFSRMHAATKPATLGLVCVLIGASFRMERPGDIAKLALVAGLQLLTAPVAAHLVGRAAYHDGGHLGPETVLDELADAE
mgnify:CR=1 FL=1